MKDRTIEEYCKKQFYSHIHAHVAVSQREFQYIIDHFISEEVKPKTPLQVAGGFCKYEYFVAKGLLQQSYLDESGKEFTVSFPRENWWAGDFKSFKNEIPTDKSLVSLESTMLLKISRSDFLQLLENSIVFERYIAKLSENNSLKMQERLLTDMSSNLEQKVRVFYQNNLDLVSRLSQKKIASFLGVSQEHLSKVLNARKDLPSIDQS